MTATAPLERRLGVVGATAIGLASMIGAGVFAVWGPAAGAAGPLLVVGLVLAAVVAAANAISTARLAIRDPHAGGAYRFGREHLGPWPGFLAGWGFVVGKAASCAAMAMTAAAYLVPEPWQRPAAAAAVVLLTVVNVLGVHRTAAVAVGIAAVVVAVVLTVAVLGLGDGLPFLGERAAAGGPLGALQSAGLLFFAFAGYARIATLGEEVRRPERTIPRAIAAAFVIAVALYALVAVAALGTLGARALAGSAAPLVDVVRAVGAGGFAPVVAVAAGVAALGALLTLLAGIGRTSLAMARDRELPGALAAVHPRFGTPHVAEIAAGAVVLVLVLAVDLRGAIGFSSFGVLGYYLVANLSALRLPGASGRAVALLGAAGCVVLAFGLPLPSVLAGLAVFAVGAATRAVAVLARRR